MTIRMTSLGLPAALLAASLFGACQNTARGLEQDTENNAAKAKAELPDAAAAAERVAHDTKQAAVTVADATRGAASEAAQKTRDAAAIVADKTRNAAEDAEQSAKNAAKTTASALDATALTMQIKTALIADKSVEGSDITVHTNESTRTVTLKGHVPSAAQKAEAGRIAMDKAPDYRIVNMLVVQ
jgi:osmotically-inducible protein OsmY